MKKKSMICVMTAAMLLGGCGSPSSSQTESSAAISAAASESEVAMPTVSQVEVEASGTEETTGAPVDQASWQMIQEYGYQEGYQGTTDAKQPEGQDSLLSYDLYADTLQDEGDYYTIEATFYKPISVPTGLQAGDTVTITVDELTGETQEITLDENGNFTTAEGNEYYYLEDADFAQADNGEIVLYEASDDRVDAAFYKGKLCISKVAITGVALEPDSYTTVSDATFSEDHWYNGVYFDSEGVVQGLIIYGD